MQKNIKSTHRIQKFKAPDDLNFGTNADTSGMFRFYLTSGGYYVPPNIWLINTELIVFFPTPNVRVTSLLLPFSKGQCAAQNKGPY